ncbi:helix-turn-helix transcriptional regulator [Bacillus sp. CH30_1T]|uniref:helix-turn-helix transcriptional regulator n=1 Tax=Bacillus sp. CH30_1T TaxID=2604836 RepID=UPI0011ED4844|nr:helix-turn-helix domain-containing protein [Bacillus sp. CH30_1T]KAA0564389.1 helix-turn-helix transcriptional regulator [Bacillus sp. CH30_1T]
MDEKVYSMKLVVRDQMEYEKLEDWITEEFMGNIALVEEEVKPTYIHIAIFEVSTWHDWVKIHRFHKRNKECKIIPLLEPTLLYTSPLAVELKLSSLIVKSVKKHKFIRILKQVIGGISSEGHVLTSDNVIGLHEEPKKGNHMFPFQEAFLRRLLSGEINSEEELIQSRSLFPVDGLPSVVCFIQGFIRCPSFQEEQEWHASMIIQDHFRKRFREGWVSFLSYRKHLLMLIRIPSKYGSLKQWKEGEESILDAIEGLEREYGIHLYIGVGSIYREPLLLHHSYREAYKARRTSPYERLSLRYYEEITKDQQIQKCTDYIAHCCTDNLSIKQVAEQINFSVPYFSRFFKQETGRNFVEYVTFVRLQRAVWLLRHTNHTIEYIAEELGFNTPNYFSGTFKKYVGLPPREYRRTEEIIFI